MKVVNIFLLFLAVKMVTCTDPARCQRVIKYMLINACGATKRHSSPLSLFNVMSRDELDQRYWKLIEAGLIKGLNALDNYINPNLHLANDNYDPEENKLGYDEELNPFDRRKREIIETMRKKDRWLTNPGGVERRGGFHFVGQHPSGEEFKSPLPGELKAKCCGDYLCTMDDFKGFCG